ncbi:MAG: glycosyltransferase, partial [Candidatus Dadabacteria bacterium]|nr:glycosyltransferase [Candidatus Dadabacteria bacterium]NIQ15206.1 glycosyltransferase [Candidatus Dadabacteria bacterium]
TLKCEADIFPFLDKHLSENETKDKIYDFLYIATPEPHKNHNNLILAWIILSEENINPHLCLALNNSERLFNNKLKDLIIEFNLKITIINNISGDDIQKLYYKSKALIFPSTFESFGIPLLEAKYHNLPIVASEKDYVRDIINPTETFDPDSPISIARAVKRFFGYTENYNKIYTSSEFLY